MSIFSMLKRRPKLEVINTADAGVWIWPDDNQTLSLLYPNLAQPLSSLTMCGEDRRRHDTLKAALIKLDPKFNHDESMPQWGMVDPRVRIHPDYLALQLWISDPLSNLVMDFATSAHLVVCEIMELGYLPILGTITSRAEFEDLQSQYGPDCFVLGRY